MLKKVILAVFVLATIGFGIFTLSVPVDAKPGVRQLYYKDVCCNGKCVFEYCKGDGQFTCCIPVQ